MASRKTSAHETMVTSVGFEVREGLYADDAQLLFASHNAMEVGTSELVHHLGRFGLVCHYAPEGTLAKDLVKTFEEPVHVVSIVQRRSESSSSAGADQD